MNPNYQLVSDFLGLPHVRRQEIALKLDLLRRTEIGLPDAEWHNRVFVRASAAGSLDKLRSAIQKG